MLKKHKNNTDVAIEVLRLFHVEETRVLKLKVRWWNIGKCHAPWCMNIIQNISVPVDKWHEWEPYDRL